MTANWRALFDNSRAARIDVSRLTAIFGKWAPESEQARDARNQLLASLEELSTMLDMLIERAGHFVPPEALAPAKPPPLNRTKYPGCFECPKCGFTLFQRTFSAIDGSVGCRDEPGEKCPNCRTALWRISDATAESIGLAP